MQAVLFDLDGVLVDTRNLHYDTLNQALFEVDPRYVISREDHEREFNGLPSRVKLARLTRDRGLPADTHTQILRRKQELTLEFLPTVVFPNAQLTAFITFLKDQCGVKVGVVSNAVRETVNTVLSLMKIESFMDVILSSEDVTFNKPSSECYVRACERLGLPPLSVVVFEDSPAGLVAAKSAGCRVIPVDGPHQVTLAQLGKALTTPSRIPCTEEKLCIVIPMAGRGSRFARQGYTDPKPLIQCHGQPLIKWVVDNLLVPHAEFVFLVQKDHCASFLLDKWLPSLPPWVPGGLHRVIPVDGVTEGAACTVLLAAEEWASEQDRPIMIANSDQWLDWDVKEFVGYARSSGADGCISTFRCPERDPKWSYVERNALGQVTGVREKVPVSDEATTGIYYWRSAKTFEACAKQMIARNERVNGEFYVAPVYNGLIRDHLGVVHTYGCRRCWGLGTPEDLVVFAARVASKGCLPPEPAKMDRPGLPAVVLPDAHL